jgi:hypothetical protein
MLFLTSMFGFVARVEGDELRDALYDLAGIIARGVQP